MFGGRPLPLIPRLILGVALLYPRPVMGRADSPRPVANSLTISAIENKQTHMITMAILREAYRQMGWQVQFASLPGQRVFEPFFTTKHQGEGTGLGLAVVHGAVKVSRGGIQLESSPGKGCLFRVYLPVTDKPSPSISEPLDKITTEQGAGRIFVCG
ncbi:MAG: hypothetical protein HQL52_05340 [Magnetococcales bacterium]|nr:hypothetical protein [Magnetococcales bacterium]